MVALERAGIKVDRYYASEIDSYAIAVSKFNWEDKIEQIGNVIEITEDKITSLGQIDLLIGGSPCQDLSSSNVWTKQKGLSGEKSSLFWEYVRILKILQSKNQNVKFLFENVGSASLDDKKAINKNLQVEGIKFNSSLLSAQNRNRMYWTNIDFLVPICRQELFTDTIYQNIVDDKYYLTQKMYDCIMSPATKNWQSGKMEINLKIARPLTSTMHKMHRADTDNYINTEYKPTNKTSVRRLTPLECERLQTLCDDYTLYGCDKNNNKVLMSDTRRYMVIGNAWTVDVIAHIFKNIKLNT